MAATVSVIAGYIPQVDKEVFELDCPVVGERPFQSAARGPADFKPGLRWQPAQSGLQIRAGDAASAVKKNAVPRIAEACTQGSEPSAFGLAAQSTADTHAY